MTRRQRGAWALGRLLTGELTMVEGADPVGLSERQLWRLQVVELRRTTYGDVNDTHLAELLAEREAIEISRPSRQHRERGTSVSSRVG